MIKGREQNGGIVQERISVYQKAKRTLQIALELGCNEDVESSRNLPDIEKNVDDAYSELLNSSPDGMDELVLKVTFVIEEVLAGADLTEYQKSGLRTAIANVQGLLTQTLASQKTR